MATNLEELFVLGISSSALFDTEEGAAIFDTQGEDAFIEYQVAKEEEPFGTGAAFPLIKALLRVNQILPKRLMEVIILSHNHPAAGLRAMNSLDKHGLTDITRAAFVGSTPISNYLDAYHVTLFLSRQQKDVQEAISRGVAAGLLLDPPKELHVNDAQLRIAFDGDSVLFSDQSDQVYAKGGLGAMHNFERENERVSIPPGPFANVLRWIARIQKEAAAITAANAMIPVRTALVTARNGVAVKRVIRTLREWNVKIDEMFFLGDVPKPEILQAFQPHIFFDDSPKNTDPASKVVPTARVLYGPSFNAAPATITTSTDVAAIATVREGAVEEIPTETLVSANSATNSGLTKKDFEIRCRAIFKSYTPLSRGRTALDDRYRVFISEHADRSAMERRKLVQALERYNLSDIMTHDPMLNREIDDRVDRKLSRVAFEALGLKQGELGI